MTQLRWALIQLDGCSYKKRKFKYVVWGTQRKTHVRIWQESSQPAREEEKPQIESNLLTP